MKVLSPAGNLECLKSAVNNGADEVYLGINEFNARNNIDGFSLNDLGTAVNYAHIRGVKVLLAINILFNNDELEKALNVVVEAYNLGIDAFIIQDLGLAKLVNSNYPEVEIHASTQMGIHNLEGVNAIIPYGFKRVVLARETPLSEIKRIKANSDIEIEYFVQGALCVSFSGNCYLSSYLYGASGNRGRCKQLCRLPYTFLHDGKPIKNGYLLSAKDFNLSKRISELKSAGVDVIKIEGRARRPFYVGMTTREYRKAVDGQTPNQDNIKLSFNRNYTEGYFNGNGEVISEYQNHIGIEVGRVTEVNNGKNFNEIYISSNRKLYPKSVFKFFDNGVEKLTLSAHDIKQLNNGIYKITSTQKVCVGNTVNLIVDFELEKEISSYEKRVEVALSVIGRPNEPLKATFSLGDHIATVTGDVCLRAEKSPLTKEEVVNCFNKSDTFIPNFLDVSLDNVFIVKSKLNEFRRIVYGEIINLLTSVKRKPLENVKIEIPKRIKIFEDFSIIEKFDGEIKTTNVIYSPEYYDIEDVAKFSERCKRKGAVCYLDTPNFATEEDVKILKNIINKLNIPFVANNYYALSLGENYVVGAGLNVYNNVTANLYDKPIIYAEGEHSAKIDYYYMTLRHCPLKSHTNSTCKKCVYDDKFAYKMENGKILRLKRKKLSSCTFYLN